MCGRRARCDGAVRCDGEGETARASLEERRMWNASENSEGRRREISFGEKVWNAAAPYIHIYIYMRETVYQVVQSAHHSSVYITS